MIVRMIIAVGVLLLMCAIMAVLARRLRGVPPTRLLINLLFPFSQLCIVAFLFYYAIAYELPFWMFALVAVVGALCGPVDLVLFKALEESEKRELSRERVRLLEEQLQAQEQYLRRLSADIDEARRVREGGRHHGFVLQALVRAPGGRCPRLDEGCRMCGARHSTRARSGAGRRCLSAERGAVRGVLEPAGQRCQRMRQGAGGRAVHQAESTCGCRLSGSADGEQLRAG